MIIPDVNVLLYAQVDGFGQHEAARTWWESALAGGELVGLAPVVVSGFVRLATSTAILNTPMSVGEAVGTVREWMGRPNVEVLTSDARHLDATLGLLILCGSAVNLTTDALIAAHALLGDAVVATNDTDFGRFAGVRVFNPV